MTEIGAVTASIILISSIEENELISLEKSRVSLQQPFFPKKISFPFSFRHRTKVIKKEANIASSFPSHDPYSHSCGMTWLELTLLNNFNIMRENYNPSWTPRVSSRNRPPNTSLDRHPRNNNPKNLSQQPLAVEGRFELPRENIMQAVSIVQWRCQTSLPILRVANYQVSPLGLPQHQKPCFPSISSARSSLLPKQKPSSQISEYIQRHPEVSHYQLRVKAEGVRWRLSQAGAVPFSQALHLLREMLIGFEALFDIFGPFDPQEELVAVSTGDQWRMWIDPDFCSSFKKQTPITERQFIYKVILMTERHSLQTVQSRLFFGAAKESTYANDCSFIKMLEKLRGFIETNRIYIPSKVAIVREGEGTGTVKATLKKLVSMPVKQPPFKKRKESCVPFTSINKSSVSLVKNPSVSTLQQLRSYPSCAQLKHNLTLTPQSPSSPMLGDRNLTFQTSCEHWGSHQNQDSSITSMQLITSPQKSKPKLTKQRSQTSAQLPAPPTLTSVQSTPIFYLSRPRHLKKPQGLDRQRKIQGKPVSQLNAPAKRANIRKYSEQLVKMKSADTLALKKFQASTISQNLFQIQEQQADKWLPTKKQEISSPKRGRQQAPTRRDAGNASSSSHGVIPSSPNNSSSTKQIGTSGQMQQAYRSLKMQDLAPHRSKNNQSLIQHHLPDPHGKNMTVSYQFKRAEPQSDSESEGSSRPPPQWVNKISDLFSDTVSIKQLKGSIRFKGQEEVFQKEHLKDVKLDMLQKFGRSVTLHVEEEDCPAPVQTRTASKHNQYKSMQLIQEQLEEVKSFQDQERQEEVATKSIRSIRSIRSRRQTQIDRQRQISFKDDFLAPPCENEGGFNFQTEMYSIRGQQRPLEN